MKGVLKKAEIHDKFDLCETLLRLGGSQDCEGKASNYSYHSLYYTYCLYVVGFGMLKIFKKLINCLNCLICVSHFFAILKDCYITNN